MTRINTNVPSLFARANLERTNTELELRLHCLSTALRLNRGADDPPRPHSAPTQDASPRPRPRR